MFYEIAEVGPDNLMIQDLSWTGYGMSDEDIILLNKKLKFKSLKIEVLNSVQNIQEFSILLTTSYI